MGPGVLGAVATGTDRVARWATIALGFSIPISVALDNFLLAVVAAGWVAGGMYREKLAMVRGNPVILAAIGLFALLAIGTTYGERNPGDTVTFLGKYLDLAFIPVFAFLLRDAATRRLALRAFAASLTVVLTLSYLIKAGLLPAGRLLQGTPANPVVFRLHITHNILMAYGAFLFTMLAVYAAARAERIAWGTLALLAAFNVLFMVQGRTGYVVLAALIPLYLYGRMRWRGLVLSVPLLAALFATAYFGSSGFRDRIDIAVTEARGWERTPKMGNSIGLRLEFTRTTLAIIGEHPVLGVGTGGFPKAYADKVQDTASLPARNPHNEYLHIAAQIGLGGLAVMLYLFWKQWRLARRLESPIEANLARGLVLTVAVGSLFTSLLLDHTEGLFYAWFTGLLFAGLQSREIGNRK
jgi:O-antigen ligase